MPTSIADQPNYKELVVDFLVGNGVTANILERKLHYRYRVTVPSARALSGSQDRPALHTAQG